MYGDRSKPTQPPLSIAQRQTVKELTPEEEKVSEIDFLTDYTIKYARGKYNYNLSKEANRIRTKYGLSKIVME